MKRASKIIIAMVAVAGISAASISLVSAQGPWDGGCPGYGPGSMQQQGPMMGRRGFGRGMSGDPAERMEQRMDMLKYQLRITEAQEPAWQAFEQSLKEKAANMMGRFRKGGMREAVPVPERVNRMREGAVNLNQLADSIEKLYAVLTPEQQKTADQMRPMMGRMR